MKKTIVLGVTGGIAAFKAAQLTSNLIKKGHDKECNRIHCPFDI